MAALSFQELMARFYFFTEKCFIKFGDAVK